MKRKINSEKRYAYAPNAHNFVHVLIHEVIDKNKLVEAIKMLHHLNPVLNSVLSQGDNGFELVEIPFMLPEIVEFERLNEKTYKKVMNEEEQIPINLKQNAAYRVLLICDEEYTDLVIFSHQIMMDASSTLMLMQAILVAYESHQFTFFNYDHLQDIQLDLSLLDHHFLDGVIRKYQEDPNFLVEEEYRHNYLDYYKTYHTKFIKLVLEQDEVNNLRKFANNYNLNIFTLIFTAFKASENKIQFNRDSHFKQSIILKSLRNNVSLFGNFATLGFISFEYNARKSLVENCKQLQKILDKTDYKSYYYLNNVLPMGAFKALEERRQTFGLEHFAHRLGYWDYKIGSELSFYDKIDVRTKMPIESIEVLRATHELVEKNISIVEYNNQIYITMQYNSKSANRKDLHEIVNNTALILTDSIKE